MKKSVTSIIITAILMLAGYNSSAQDMLPNMKVKTPKGQEVSIHDLVKDHKFTIINFWATWCLPCRKELENIQDLYPEWQEEYDVELIAVSIDDSRTKSKVMPYVNGEGFDYTIVMDDNKEFFISVNGANPPLTLLVNSNFEIIERKIQYLVGDEYILDEKLAELSKEN